MIEYSANFKHVYVTVDLPEMTVALRIGQVRKSPYGIFWRSLCFVENADEKNDPRDVVVINDLTGAVKVFSCRIYAGYDYVKGYDEDGEPTRPSIS